MSNFGKSDSLKLTQTQMFASQNKQKWKLYHFEKHVLVFQLPNAFRMELMTNFLDCNFDFGELLISKVTKISHEIDLADQSLDSWSMYLTSSLHIM